MDTVLETMGAVPEIQKAFAIANQANLSREELEDLEKQEIYIHDQRNAIKRAIRQGREQGRQEGREEGVREAKLEIAKQLLDILDEEMISQKTGLSLEDIQNLKQGRADSTKPSLNPPHLVRGSVISLTLASC